MRYRVVRDDLTFPQLQNLDCSSFQVSSWSAFAVKFSKLPRLQQLSLDDNPIPTIPESTEPSFVSLKSLQLAGTAIASWRD
jgi:Leucine-rich repeat (LRR) protein